jgi:hypothetical protein
VAKSARKAQQNAEDAWQSGRYNIILLNKNWINIMIGTDKVNNAASNVAKGATNAVNKSE